MSAVAQVARRWRRILHRRRDLVGINRRNVELVYAENPRRNYPIADDKLLTKEYLIRAGVPVAETIATCDSMATIPRVLAAISGRSDFVIKPGNASGGAGILVVADRLGDGLWRKVDGATITVETIRHHLAEIVFGTFASDMEDKAFVEPRIIPHPFFHALWSRGLCDVRVITLRGEPLISMVRVPTVRSAGRANLHQGGIGLAVDLATGRTTRAWSGRATLERHPETGQPLLGLTLPEWPAILAVSQRAARAIPLGYLGVDVVVDHQRGPLILEVNARPGLEIQNVNGFGIGPLLPEDRR